MHRDVHAGNEINLREAGQSDLDRDDLGDFLEVAPGVALGEQGEHSGGTVLDFDHASGDVSIGIGVDVNVHQLPEMHCFDVGLVDTRRDVDLFQVVCHGELGAGGDIGADHAVVHGDGAIAGCLDGHLGCREPSLYLDTADAAAFVYVGTLGCGPVKQGAGGGRVDGDLVSVDLGVIGTDIVAGVEEIAHAEGAPGKHRHDRDHDQGNAGGALQAAPRRCRRGGRGAVGGQVGGRGGRQGGTVHCSHLPGLVTSPHP